MTLPGVTIAVPTLNRVDSLLKTLESLYCQEYPVIEILIVDQTDTPDARVINEVKSRGKRISYYKVDFKGLPRARNFAWQKALHDIVVFIDDDVDCCKELVSRHVETLQKKHVGLVAGGVEEPNKKGAVGPPTGIFNSWAASGVKGFETYAVHESDLAQGCNFSVWKKVISESGGFDERLCVGADLFEEVEFALRVKKTGYKVFFNGHARLTHFSAPSGGCRMQNIAIYAYSLVHNRAMLIRRYVPLYKRPVAMALTLKTAWAYAISYRRPDIFASSLTALAAGLRDGGLPRICTRQ